MLPGTTAALRETYDESADVITKNNESALRTGELLRLEIENNRETEGDRVMRGDVLITKTTPNADKPRRLPDPEEPVYSFEPLANHDVSRFDQPPILDSPQKVKMSRELKNISSDPSWNREVVETSGPRLSRSQTRLQSHTAKMNKADA